jgi:hypothetical protein
MTVVTVVSLVSLLAVVLCCSLTQKTKGLRPKWTEQALTVIAFHSVRELCVPFGLRETLLSWTAPAEPWDVSSLTVLDLERLSSILNTAFVIWTCKRMLYCCDVDGRFASPASLDVQNYAATALCQ